MSDQQAVGQKRGKLLWCCLVAGLCLLAFYIQQKNQLQQAASELAQLQRNAQRISALRRHHPPDLPQGSSLQTLLKSSAEKHDVLLGMLRGSQQTLEVALPPQPLKPLLLWLGSLQQEYGVGVDAVDLSLQGDDDVATVKELRLHVPSIR
ncbi:type II secretion system protein GspM [Serratia quinivorans]|uniref:type II secretion system protein GspM n=1 Tax=Serratia quinivorans TaxID=137545 RepID=UPI00217AD77C|nr:type II secretion system protein GspM [Serratia quinivorans]CAI1069657.1 Cholera toxin secretion protein epsM [Serratia quinivorans]